MPNYRFDPLPTKVALNARKIARDQSYVMAIRQPRIALANAGTLQDKPKTTLFGKKTELKMRTRIHEIKKLENIDEYK